MRSLDRSNDLIQLQMDRARVAVLRVLYEEYHQEGNDRGRCVHYQLPSIRIFEIGPCQSPNHDQRNGSEERPLTADYTRSPGSEVLKPVSQPVALVLRMLDGRLHRLSDPSEQEQYDQDYRNQSETAARVVAPASAVRPRG